MLRGILLGNIQQPNLQERSHLVRHQGFRWLRLSSKRSHLV
ncbi:hypothetical protein [Moorena sp. SIOASIH]|nr:hypothetical protein [Moorena sp. SIOASIH]